MTQSCPGRLMSPGGLAIQAPVLRGFSTKGDLALVDLGEDTNPGTLLCSLRLGGSPRHGAPGPTPRLPSTSLHPAGQPSSLCCPRLSPKQPFIDHQNHQWLSWWRIRLQCRRPEFDPWVGKIPQRRERLPTPVSGLENSLDCIVHGVTKSRT